MWKATSLLKGAILGAGAMYFFDPRMGNRRRALFQDQLRHLSRHSRCGVDAGLRDLSNRTQGMLHDLGRLVSPPVSSNQLGQEEANRKRKERRTGWSPAARLLGTIGGSMLMARCALFRTPSSVVAGTLGFGLFAKSIDAGPGGIHVTKTLDINASSEQVFDFFSHPENYLRISDIVTNVEVFGDGRFAKDMTIAGVPVHFEERFITCEPNRLLETRSEPASAVQYTKQLKLDEVDQGRTRLHLHFNYHPPGGAIGHAVASALGIDAKSLLSDLLMRAKFFLETGREPHDAFARRQRQAHGHPRRSGNGRQRQHSAANTPQGPGAPASDVHRLGMHDFEGESPWPPSSEGRPDLAGAPGHFPPTID